MKRIALLLPCLVFAAGPAAAQDVSYNFDQDTDFSQFKSYKCQHQRCSRSITLPRGKSPS